MGERVLGLTGPLNTYKVRHAIYRATDTPKIMEEDRIAMLKDATRLAERGIQAFRNTLDRFPYVVYAEVGVALAERGGGTVVLDKALAEMRAAAARIIDPEFAREIREQERTRLRWK